MRRGFRFRFVAMIFAMMCVAGMMAACVTGVLLNGQVGRTLRESQQAIAEMMIELSKKSTLTTDEIIKLCARDMYAIRRTSVPFAGDIQHLSSSFFSRAETFVRIHGDGVRISLSPGKMLTILFFYTILITAGTAVLVGTAIAVGIGSTTLKPLNALIDGIEKVAQGDFSVRVPMPKIKWLYRLTRSFNRMVEELSGTETLKKDFVNDVSHEFRTPLSSIHGFATLLQDPALSDTDRLEYSRIIAAESKRLATLASDILSLSKLENQSIVTDREWFSLDEQLRQTVVMFEPSFSAKRMEVQVELPPLRYFGNAGMLRPVWVNLLSNAVKFTPDGGSISVRLIDAEDEVIVRIKDTGIGMDDETLTRIFEKFYQGDAAHAREGAGLGLPLARRIVALCGGEILVKSAVGQGSSFSVKLPTAR